MSRIVKGICERGRAQFGSNPVSSFELPPYDGSGYATQLVSSRNA
jgi:hypothetical protein